MGTRVRGRCDYKGIRRAARGEKYQARPHVGPTRADNFNCGLYRSDVAAAEVAKAFRRRRADRAYRGEDTCPAVVLAELQAEGVIRPDVLPRWVKRDRDGGYVGEHKLIGRTGPHPDPVTCYRVTLSAVLAARAASRVARILGGYPLAA